MFDGQDIRVIRRGAWANTGPCVVTFDCYQVEPRLERQGFGETFFEGRGVDAIHVLSRENDWYQNRELDAALQVVAKTVAGRGGRVCTYGASMGGYAALRFGRRIGARSAIALAPQFSIDPTVAPFDRRWKESQLLSFRPEVNAAFELPERAVVIYDPSVPEDARHVALIADQGAIEPAPILYAGHSVGLMLGQLRLLGEFVIDLLEGRGDVRELVRTARMHRRESGQYWASLARLARRRRVDLACQMAACAVELVPDYIEYRDELSGYERLRRAAGAAAASHSPVTLPEQKPPSLAQRALGRLVRWGRGG